MAFLANLLGDREIGFPKVCSFSGERKRFGTVSVMESD